MQKHKIAIVGVGAVGATIAYACIMRNLNADILLVDVNKNRCEGEFLDLSDAVFINPQTHVFHATFAQAAQADIIIIAAGVPQKPGQLRSELFAANKQVFASICAQLAPLNSDAKIIIVANPVDALTLYAQEIIKLPKQQIFGTGTFLDSERLTFLLAQKCAVPLASVRACVLGEHGDTQFVAWSQAIINNKSLIDSGLLTAQECAEIAHTTREKAYKIIECKGNTSFGIATCVSELCKAIIEDTQQVFPLSVYVEEFGVCLSVLAVLGKMGVSRKLDVHLSEVEMGQLRSSAEKIKKVISFGT